MLEFIHGQTHPQNEIKFRNKLSQLIKLNQAQKLKQSNLGYKHTHSLKEMKCKRSKACTKT
jgi:hypothetical protein